MKTHTHILVALATFGFCLGVTAQSQKPVPILKALPTAESLGPEWKRGITVLFDTASQPPEIINTAKQMPDSFKQEQRAAVENPTNRISGWSHLFYEVNGTNQSGRYDVNIERFRSKEVLTAEFDRLLKLEAAQYHKTELKTVGEAAVIYSDATNGLTLWFRRGNFRVWICPLTVNRPWRDDLGLQQLAEALDDRLRADAGVDAGTGKSDSPQKE
jgi:hypothetical protein